VGSPLEGVLVLDLSRVLAGPFCTMMLADLGARVVKVEHPVDGDVTRGWGPPYHEPTRLSAYYLSVNRNKESIALDLSTPDGAESVRRLARRADVLVENFPPGGLEKFGLSLSDLRRENPRLVTASVTGFGRVGPDATAPGFDLLAQAGAGFMAVTGTTEAGPTKAGIAVSDLLAGCYLAVGILAALTARASSGRGAHVETDLFSATLGSLINVAQSVLMTGREAERFGNAHPQIVPYRTFHAADGAFVLGVGTDRQFERLAALLGRPEWIADERLRTNDARVTNRGTLEAELESIFRRDTREAWVARCRAADIPAGPVRGPLEALRSATASALQSVIASRGVEFVASPIRVEGQPRRMEFPPALNADGERIRKEFDLPDSTHDPRPATHD
jgi:crotonobetainyl-CoA:carnitine CoA-transferase CaiB-like acyl-CoA transferase